MAFGDLVKSAFSAGSTTTQTPDLGSNPTSGNLLLFFSGNRNSEAFTGPSGFTLVNTESGGPFTSTIWYKLSVGTEQSASITWTTTVNSAWYAEYEWDGSTPAVLFGEDTTNVNTAGTTSQNTGSITPAQTTNIVLGAVGADASLNVFTGQSWTSGTIDHAFTANTNRGEIAVVRWVNASGSQSSTFTTTDTGDEMYGIVIDFSSGAGGGGGSADGAARYYYSMQLG